MRFKSALCSILWIPKPFTFTSSEVHFSRRISPIAERNIFPTRSGQPSLPGSSARNCKSVISQTLHPCTFVKTGVRNLSSFGTESSKPLTPDCNNCAGNFSPFKISFCRIDTVSSRMLAVAYQQTTLRCYKLSLQRRP